MKTYVLYTKISTNIKKEILNKIECQNLDEAIFYFSKIKNINNQVLLDIFEIKELNIHK